MDIQKEREAFEAWVNSKGRSVDRFTDGSYKSMTLDNEWKAWQAAKAQAVPEGFVLVPKEIPDSVIERLRYSSYHWGDGTRDYFTPIYQMMIEAQEPAK